MKKFIYVLMLFLGGVAFAVEEAKLIKEKGILQSFGIETTDPAVVSSEFAKIQTIEKNGSTYYVKEDGGASLYSTAYSGLGIWGDVIEGFISVNADVTKVMGFSVTNHSETSGMGAIITEKWFLDQLKGETIVNDAIRVRGIGRGDKNKNNGRIDAITGATRTSEAIQSILKKSIKRFKKDLGR